MESYKIFDYVLLFIFVFGSIRKNNSHELNRNERILFFNDKKKKKKKIKPEKKQKTTTNKKTKTQTKRQ